MIVERVIDAEIVTFDCGGQMSVSGARNAAAVIEEEMQEAFEIIKAGKFHLWTVLRLRH